MSALVSVAATFASALAAGGDGPSERTAFDPLGEERGARYVAARRFGTSARGRPLRVDLYGRLRAPRRILVFGCTHGDECAGSAVTRAVRRRGCPPLGADIWLVNNLNPDGRRIGTRLNGRGVDLNRNFASAWRPIGRRGDPEHSGPRPFSEPETRAARRLIRLFRPHVTIWFHQQADRLVRAWGPSIPEARRYARLSGLPFARLPWMDGTAPNWQNHHFPRAASFVVEMPLGSPSAAAVRRHANAIAGLAGIR